MEDEFIEGPCPETNTLQVGDLVRVYDPYHRERWAYVVTKKDGELLCFDVEPERPLVHFKQCRPLKKKEPPKPSVWWVYPNELTYETVCSSRSASPQVIGWIRVQDRCDSCGKDFNK